MFDLSPFAARYTIEVSELATCLTNAGWNFDTLNTSDPVEMNFAERTAETYASGLATRKAQRAATMPTLTVAAQASPSSICGRCSGQGKIRGFGHIESGKCFACGGSGVRKARKGS